MRSRGRGLLPVWLSEAQPPEAGPPHLRAASGRRVRELVEAVLCAGPAPA